MLHCNRVNPFGEIIATKARGAFMGNRDNLGNVTSETKKLRWEFKRWITCVLSVSGRPEARDPGIKYTRLFFLDEATALSAGHRPCAQCRNNEYRKFVDAWLRGNPDACLNAGVKIVEIDRRIHAERVTQTGKKNSYSHCIDDLPDGVMIERTEYPGEAWLLWKGDLHRWDPAGYRDRQPIPKGLTVLVLTPGSIVRAIAAGYIPNVALT